MMATTHAFAALAVAAIVAIVLPEFAFVIAVAAIAGGIFPDLDLYAGHRRNLHFPIYYWVLGAVSAVVAILVTTPTTIGLSIFVLAAGMHSTMDVFGGGLELKPWEGTSDRAVYSHYHDRWLEPRRWIRYDGAPEDLLLSGLLVIPAALVFGDPIDTVVLGLLAVSVGYVLVRKPLVVVAERVLERIPEPVFDAIPDQVLPMDEADLERFRER
ncbi:metal-dependent hydrolase [Natronosalvus vescus]|uniref:metal-dependent hydrolase n=1 Tax=Natronosalvus vescus TaxID=2953881 RepID=UPI002091E258|nr:metal-dependent hydrolase [Natronosalvus vescus]